MRATTCSHTKHEPGCDDATDLLKACLSLAHKVDGDFGGPSPVSLQIHFALTVQNHTFIEQKRQAIRAETVRLHIVLSHPVQAAIAKDL